jgi:hypothetical protein
VRGWCEAGICQDDRRGVLAIDVAPGESVLDVVYRPVWFVAGLMISLVFVVGLLVALGRCFWASGRVRRAVTL